jgi:hypothetical protein
MTDYKRPVLWLWASLPALAAIGRRAEALDQAYLRYEEGKSWRELVAEEMQAIERLAKTRDPDSIPEQSHPGRYRIQFGHRSSTTRKQQELLAWLQEAQYAILDDVKCGVCRLFDETIKWRFDPSDHVLFPDDATEEEKLDRFSIRYFDLDPKGRFLTIELDSADAWYDEHGCSIVFRDGKLWACGSWDDVSDAYYREQGSED